MISVQYILSTGLFHLDSKLPPWWFPLGDFTLVISPWWFRDQLTSLNTLWRILLVPPKFSYSHGNFQIMPPASCFWVFNYRKFKYHGPLVHWWIPFDRCVGSFSEVNEGRLHRAAGYYSIWGTIHDVLLLHLGQPSLLLASRTRDPQSLWWRREWHVTSVACLPPADPLLVVPPTTC